MFARRMFRDMVTGGLEVIDHIEARIRDVDMLMSKFLKNIWEIGGLKVVLYEDTGVYGRIVIPMGGWIPFS